MPDTLEFANVTINGVKLNQAQVMTLQAALLSFQSSLFEPGALGTDAHGIAMREGYKAQLSLISRMW